MSLTCDTCEIERTVGVFCGEVQILRHLFQDEQMSHQEELPIQHRGWRVFRLQRVGRRDERLFAQVDSLLSDVVEYGGLRWHVNHARVPLTSVLSP